MKLKKYVGVYRCKDCGREYTIEWMIPFGSDAQRHLHQIDDLIDKKVMMMHRCYIMKTIMNRHITSDNA